jgi:hypothetical protein
MREYQAFPTTIDGESDGMTLRDYFAAKAMQAYIQAGCAGTDHHKSVAKKSYDMANKMLEEMINNYEL